MVQRIVPTVVLACMLLLSGCGSSNMMNTVTPAQSRLFVSAQSQATISRFDGAATATNPSAVISGTSTTLIAPRFILLDQQANRLFVADTNHVSVTIFENASSKNGNAPPDRVISGILTTFSAPQAIAVDTTRNLLYVADSNNLLVFSNASTVNGNVAPVRTLVLGFRASEVLLDQVNDRLFTAQESTSSSMDAINVYDGISMQASGSLLASRTIAGANTGLNFPNGLGLDAMGRLVVSNLVTPSITIYANAATASGNISPVAKISGGNTSLSAPRQLVLDNAAGALYVADPSRGAVMVFSSISTATGDVAPAHTITMAGAQGVALGMN